MKHAGEIRNEGQIGSCEALGQDARSSARQGGLKMLLLNRRARRIALSIAAAASLTVLLPSVAEAACTSQATSNPFEGFGDNANYVLAPGGSFETGAPGWSLSDASIVEGNESFAVAGGSHSLALEAGGGAVSPSFCISSEYPTFRIFDRQLSGSSSSSLSVSVRWVDVLGITVETNAGSIPQSGAWAPSPVLKLANTSPLWLPGGSADVSLDFQVHGHGSWAIDDVYLDPYSR